MLTSYKLKEATFQRHDPQGKLNEHLHQVGFIWSYSHEYLLSGELSQQQVLVKSQIPSIDEMTRANKEEEIQRAIVEKNRAAIERKNPIRIKDGEESSSSSSIFVNNLDLDQEDLVVLSHPSPTLVEDPLPMHLKEVHSSTVMEKILFERH